MRRVESNRMESLALVSRCPRIHCLVVLLDALRVLFLFGFAIIVNFYSVLAR